MRTSRGMRRLVRICLLLFPLTLLAAGCGKEGTLSGKILYKGQPVKGGTVIFIPEGKGGNFNSVIGLDGSYSVSKLPPGKAKIGVAVGTQGVPADAMKAARSPGAKKGMEQMGRIGRAASKGGGEESGKADGAKKEPFLVENIREFQKYSDPEGSGLTVEVTGGNQHYDIELK